MARNSTRPQQDLRTSFADVRVEHSWAIVAHFYPDLVHHLTGGQLDPAAFGCELDRVATSFISICLNRTRRVNMQTGPNLLEPWLRFLFRQGVRRALITSAKADLNRHMLTGELHSARFEF